MSIRTTPELREWLSTMREHCSQRAQWMDAAPGINSERATEWWLDSTRFYADAYDELVDYCMESAPVFIKHLNQLYYMHVDERPGWRASLKIAVDTING